MISCLSLLLDIDLETFIDKNSHDINLENLYYKIIINQNDQKLNDYFELIIKGKEPPYFSDYYFSNKNKIK